LPTIEVDTALIGRLLGRRLGVDELEELLFNFKGEVEGWRGDHVAVELASDRPDLLCASGLARAFKGYLHLELGLPHYLAALGDGSKRPPGTPTIRVEGVVAARPFIGSYYVWGLALDEAAVADIIGFQEALHNTLSRGRRRFAIGVHDVSRLSTVNLVYRGAEPRSIRFTPLNADRPMDAAEILGATDKGREYGALLEGVDAYPLLENEAGEVLSMPPIINSNLTRVEPSTTRILVDVTGGDQGVVDAVAQLVACNIAEYGSGLALVEVQVEAASVGRRGPWAPGRPLVRRFELDAQYVGSTLGLDLSPAEVERLLAKSRLGASAVDGSKVTVDVPLYRMDVLHAVDLVEDVAMMYGYNRITPTLPSVPTLGGYHAMSLVGRAARTSLSTLGFVEVNSLALTSSRLLRLLGFSGWVGVANPWSEDLDALRPTLVAGLLGFVGRNQTAPKPIRVFEVGQVGSVEGGLYVQSLRAAGVLCDNVAAADQVEAYLNRFMDDLGLRPSYSACDLGFLIEGRRATVNVGGGAVGFVGEVSPQVLRALGIDYPVALFEVTLYTPRFSGLTFK
jgi:phenylalanyl-tRNA synthetase beta chain